MGRARLVADTTEMIEIVVVKVLVLVVKPVTHRITLIYISSN